jgi:aminoglycoside phosphotransferase (APT) family kinase protein
VDNGVSAAALEWVMAETAADVVEGVEPLAGGLTSALHWLRLRGSAGQHDVVLRQMTVEPWRSFAAELLQREAETQIALEATDVPAPRLVAVDPLGERAGEPSLLMTRIPGRTRLTGFDLGRLAAMLVRIHSIHPARPPRTFQLWTEPARWVVPPWARDALVFEAAFARIAGPAPGGPRCFMHRDYQPGNVLFDGPRLCGVVDWVEASWGPPALDVAHCQTNIALLDGVDAAAPWRATYVAAGGTLSEDPDYWALMDAVSMLPEPAKLLPAWRAAGRSDLSPDMIRERFEQYLRALLRPAESVLRT